jgi:LPS-assembly lipoprotein
MRRRTCLLATTALLGGCGFALRGSQNFAFRSFASNFAEGSSLGQELLRNLEAANGVRILKDAEAPKAEVFMDVVQDQREKTVVGVGAAGQVREFQLRQRLVFKLRNAAGTELIPQTELLQVRDVAFNETAVLAKESEEGLLYRNMQSDIVQQVLRRLAAVRGL